MESFVTLHMYLLMCWNNAPDEETDQLRRISTVTHDVCNVQSHT